jgi:hypothetical protein
MKRLPLALLLAFSLLIFVSPGELRAQTLGSFEVDNSKTMKINPSATPPASLGAVLNNYSFDAYWTALKNRLSTGNVNMGFWSSLLVDPPMTLDDAIGEYRSTSGGGVTGFLGISAFSLQNGLVKAFMSLLLLIFVGSAVLQGLTRVATGQGDLNYVNLALKFFVGIIVVFFPHMIYGTVRVVQTAGVYMAQAAMKPMAGSGMLNRINGMSFSAQEADQIFADTLAQVQADLGPYMKLGEIADVQAAVPVWNDFAPLADPPVTRLSTPASGDSTAATQAASDMVVQFPQIVGKNTDLLATYATKKDQYLTNVRNDYARASEFKDQFMKDIRDDVTAKAKEIYPIETGGGGWVLFNPKEWGQKLMNWVVSFVTSFISSVLIPIVSWIMTRVACLIMELTLVVTVITYPLWFLDATRKAFIGTFNTLMMTAIMPAVGIILLLLFEAIATNVFYPVIVASFFFWFTTLVLMVAYGLFWVIGCIIILWKTPSIAKSILEGGSFVGQFMGGMMTAGISSALAGVGIASSLASLAVPAAAPALQAANSAAQGAGKGLAEGAGAAAGGGGGGGGGDGGGGGGGGGEGTNGASGWAGGMGKNLSGAAGNIMKTAAATVEKPSQTAGQIDAAKRTAAINSHKDPLGASLLNTPADKSGSPAVEAGAAGGVSSKGGASGVAKAVAGGNGTGDRRGSSPAVGRGGGSMGSSALVGASRVGGNMDTAADVFGSGVAYGPQEVVGGGAGDAGPSGEAGGAAAEGGGAGGQTSGGMRTTPPASTGFGKGRLVQPPKMTYVPGRGVAKSFVNRMAAHAHNAVVLGKGAVTAPVAFAMGERGSAGRQALGAAMGVAGKTIVGAALSGGDPGQLAKVVGGYKISQALTARQKTDDAKTPQGIT